MNPTALAIPAPVSTGDSNQISGRDQQVRNQIRRVLGGTPSSSVPSRRVDVRQPFPYPIRLIPVDPESLRPLAPPISVLGKHLSERGVDFYHDQPLAFRHMVATIERPGQPAVHLLLDLTWCRFGRHGWYENGGRFVQVLQEEDLPAPEARTA